MKTDRIDDLLKAFERKSGLANVQSEVSERAGVKILTIFVAQPNERLFSILNGCVNSILEDGSFEQGSSLVATLKKRASNSTVSSPEAGAFLKVLSEIQNINRFSFIDDFFDRYTQSVTGAEEQIISRANHLVRLLHVVSEGITPKEAGKKFMALILDFGFYTGVRAAPSVDLFNRETAAVSAKDLRKLKIFKPTKEG